MVAAVLLLLAPATAQAAFTTTSDAALTASTYTIPAPGSVSATIVCTQSARQATVTVTGYGKVARATAYTFILTAPDGTSTSVTTTLDAVTLIQTSAYAGSRVYTLAAEARVGTWTGLPLTQPYAC
jgi:hypothetical protein